MRSPPQESAPRKSRPHRVLPVLASLAVHVVAVLALLAAQTDSPKGPEPAPVEVSLVEGFSLLPAPTPPATTAPDPTPAEPTPQKPAAAKVLPPQKARPTAVRADVEPIAAGGPPTSEPGPALTDGQLASAATAESGSPGGACNMVRWLQTALRKDRRIRDTLEAAHRASGSGAKAYMVWNGDWIRSGDQEGKGLAGVRQAILVEVAFAPEACRAQPVHGLVLISLNDAPDSPRLALGAGDWRWSDLLFPNRGGAAMR